MRSSCEKQPAWGSPGYSSNTCKTARGFYFMNHPIKTIIVDDEPLACRRLQRLLRADEEIHVIAVCNNGQQALLAIEEHHPELLFLDIQMPGIDGFGVLQDMDISQPPQIIFVTAYDRYAIQAF